MAPQRIANFLFYMWLGNVLDWLLAADSSGKQSDFGTASQLEPGRHGTLYRYIRHGWQEVKEEESNILTEYLTHKRQS